ncbi:MULTISPECIES: hypothetical protein [unclassified Photobacterium]|uniref:hypothetical protein n=1 Tax=unclassified Photobacterium TaxID=2628852 RepID=UPI001EDFF914|nr:MULTISPECIES: hypothetical protein [unclassified Photobacterium]MCG3865510.1 hypothetical protein [Photobacterium sp. Ph6]MCG3877011.1 hypothetical protein [Photobacterium sp. Ph5]
MKKLRRLMSHLKSEVIESIEYKQRIWIINVNKNGVNDGSSVINEDTFSTHLAWMVNHGYSPTMLQVVDNMRKSETKTIMLDNEIHHLMRVK